MISFTNDLWQLDPSRDYLIAIFPEGFFFDATMWIAGLTIAQAVILTTPAALLRLRAAIQRKRALAAAAARDGPE